MRDRSRGRPKRDNHASPVYVIAHIGNIPVEEWAPFLVPLAALYLYGRHRNRRHREAIQRLPDASALDAATTGHVLARWAKANHTNLAPEYLPLLYPPGPEGMTAGELAKRIQSDPATVERQLEALEDLGYLELKRRDDSDAARAWLTIKGYDLLDETETALLSEGSQP